MVTVANCVLKYGTPEINTKWLTLWQVPEDLQIGAVPRRIYCNKDLVDPLTRALSEIKRMGLSHHIKTWDGCFNIRPVRGYEKKYDALRAAGKLKEAAQLLSLHSWAIAIDINAFENRLGQVPKLGPAVVGIFKDAGFDWGGDFKRADGMHFQLSKI